VVEERGEPLLLPFPCDFPYALQRLCHACPVLRPVRACWPAFPSVSVFGSTDSAAVRAFADCSEKGCSALFAGFTATMLESDFSCPCIIGFGSSPSHTQCNRCVRFATTVTSGHATLATKRTLRLTWTGLPPAGSQQLSAGAPIRSIHQRGRRGWVES
jgi:hypothetical protein